MARYRRLLPVLWEKSGGICALCDKPLEPSPAKVHIDHVIPRVLGGTDDVDNLQAVHKSCNSRKGHRPLAEAIVRIRTTPVGHGSGLRPGQTLVAFHMPPDLLRRVEDFQFGNRIPSRGAAIRWMIDKGLELNSRPD